MFYRTAMVRALRDMACNTDSDARVLDKMVAVCEGHNVEQVRRVAGR